MLVITTVSERYHTIVATSVTTHSHHFASYGRECSTYIPACEHYTTMAWPHLVILIVISTFNVCCSQGITQCGECRCIYIEPYYTVDCEGLELDALPHLDEMITMVMTRIYLKNNKLTELDSTVLRGGIISNTSIYQTIY